MPNPLFEEHWKQALHGAWHVYNWAWYAVSINDYSKVFIIHKNMACCGFVACSILTSDLYVTMETCLKSGFQIWGVGVQSPPPPLPESHLPLEIRLAFFSRGM